MSLYPNCDQYGRYKYLILLNSSYVPQNSSVEGVFASQRSTHPFRIIESDAISIQSMTSLGRVGRILAGTVDVANSIADKDTNSISAISLDCNAASTSNVSTTMIDSMADRGFKSKASNSGNGSTSSSNDNTSNNVLILQGMMIFNIVNLLNEINEILNF